MAHPQLAIFRLLPVTSSKSGFLLELEQLDSEEILRKYSLSRKSILGLLRRRELKSSGFAGRLKQALL